MPPKKPTAAKGASKAKPGPKKAAAGSTSKKAAPAAAKAEAPVVEVSVLDVEFKELGKTLMRDQGELADTIKASGKWPFVIDPSERSASFLRHRDCNYLNAVDPADMQPNRIRLAIMGAIRYGKPAALDLMECEIKFEECVKSFNEAEPGLMDSILDKSIMKEDKYCKLIRDEDGPEYHVNNFSEMYTEKFQFFLLTSHPSPPPQVMQKMFPVKVKEE